MGAPPCPVNLGAVFAQANQLSDTMQYVYLDHAATTPLREEVVAVMDPYLRERFGNPSSVHRWGREASAALEEARAELARAIDARPSEVRFVRGGTESDNLAIIGGVRGLRRADSTTKPVVIVSAIEHSAVLEPAEWLHERGEAEMRVAPVGPDGMLDLPAVLAGLGGRPCIVSTMWVNNETGIRLPIHDVVRRCSELSSRGVVHSDASQALGKVPVSVEDATVDLLTGTGHKLGGPRGSGFLYVREGVRVEPILHGGGQERALRPGTEDVAGAVGLARAVRLAVDDLERSSTRMRELTERLEARLSASIPGLRINGQAAPRGPHVVSLGLPGIEDGAAFLMALDLEGVAASGGSACHSGAPGGSHVIAALYGRDDGLATVRLSVGRDTSSDDVDRAAEIVSSVWARAGGNP